MAGTCLSQSGWGQTAAPLAPNPTPDYRVVDENQVDMGAGTYMGDLPGLTVGVPGKGGMSWKQNSDGTDNLTATLTAIPVIPVGAGPGGENPWGASIRVDNRVFTFKYNWNGGFTELSPVEGDTLTCANGQDTVFTAKHGGTAHFPNVGCLGPNAKGTFAASSRTFPDGEVWTYNYGVNGQAGPVPNWGYGITNFGMLTPQLTSVTNNFGYMIKYNFPSGSGESVIGINTASEYCNPYAAICTPVNNWPSITFSTVYETPTQVTTACYGFSLGSGSNPNNITSSYTDADNNTTRFSYNTTGCTSGSAPTETTTITEPSGRVKTLWVGMLRQICGFAGQDLMDGLSVTCLPATPQWVVASYSDGVSTWNYHYQYDGSITSYVNTISVRTDPLGNKRQVEVLPDGQAIYFIDELNRKTTISANGPLLVPQSTAQQNEGQINSITRPEGDTTSYTYDAAANVLTVTRSPATGSSLANLIMTYTYNPPNCTPKTCNYPATVTDPNGNVTSYTYDPNSGDVATVTEPAVNGIQPQTRYTYTAHTGQALNGSGVLTPQSSSVYLLASISNCQTATAANPASCVGTSAEEVTTNAYNGNNLLLTSQTAAAGDGSISATTSYTYDNVGNLVIADGPRTDVDDRSYKTYDVLRRVIFDIGIDPDGSGPLPRVVVKHNYDGEGREYLTQTGTGNATDGSDFVQNSYVLRTYDPNTGLLVKTITATVP